MPISRKLLPLALIVFTFAVAAPSMAWKFASIADSRGSNNGVNTSELTTIVGRINAENVDFVIFEGDAVTGCADSCLSSQMDTWLPIINGLNCPWYYTPGNHEIPGSTSQAVVRGKVNMPLNGPAGDEEMAYWFEHANARFVALNSDHYGLQHKVQLSWLKPIISDTLLPHVFVYSHDPAYPAGPHIGSSLDTYPTDRDDFWNYINAAGVGTYFCGHEHLYQRSKHANVYQVINGTCGAPIPTTIYAGTTQSYQYVVYDVNDRTVTCAAKYDTGVTFDTWSYTAPLRVNCDTAKFQTDTTPCALYQGVVTYVSGSTFYVEQPDRKAAFRASGASGIAVGDKVVVSGTLGTITASGERQISGTVAKLYATTPIKPVGMAMKSILGGTRGYNQGADGASGLNNSGMLVRIFGEVTSTGTGEFYLDDGSGILDGTSWSGQPNRGVRIASGASVAAGQFHTVTGIVSAMKYNGKIQRYILATSVE